MRALFVAGLIVGLVTTAWAKPKPKPLPKAIVLVLDRSGSMRGARLDAAKAAAKVVVDTLNVGDFISVVAFDSEALVLVRPQRVGSRDRIKTEIDRLESGGGTNIFPGLKEAHEILQGIKASKKHVILLSDGEAPTDGIAELVSDMRAAKVTTSAVGIQGADRDLLQLVAETGDGRLFFVEDLDSLSKIFEKEAREGLR